MLPQQSTQEQLSRAYLHAVTARAGCTFSVPNVDFGVDVYIHYHRRVKGHIRPFGGVLGVQLKATTRAEVRGGEIVVSIPAKTYEDLTEPSTDPRVLVVLAMPEEENSWLEASDDALLLRKCAYWATPEGWTAPPPRSNLRVRIPVGQRFDVDALNGPLQKLARTGLE